MKYYIVTGASKGLGEAIAKQLVDKDNVLFTIARSASESLKELAEVKGCSLHQIHCDLSDGRALPFIMKEMVSSINLEEAEGIYLINNAGVIAPISPIEGCSSEAIIINVAVNLTAPTIMVSEFIRLLEGYTGEKRVINISSGAGKHPYSGWSIYCATKAGLDLFTETVGLEQKEKRFPVEILSLAPGIVDTPMQGEIRESSESDFPDIHRFKEFKEQGHLSKPEDVAVKVVSLLHSKSFEQGGVLDVRG